jgi:phospholipid/cholesterol/gamma-HCH transport system substrate-binding protein
MARRHRWTQLLPGVLTLAGVLALAASVLLYARVGALRGSTVRLYAPTNQARGVLKGTEVWLAGRKVGVVDDVRFGPPSVDTAARVVIVMDVLEEHADQIRRNSFAQIRNSGTLVGAPVVFVATGSPHVPPVRHRDTLATRPQSEVEGVRSQVAVATRDVPEIIANLRSIGAQLGSARGSAGAILQFDPSAREYSVLQQRAGRFTRSVTSGPGTVGLTMRGGELAARARALMARADSLRIAAAAPRTTMGRARSDSLLLRAITDVRNDVSITRALLAEPRGTAGRVLADSALALELARFDRELDALIRDVKQRPLRYVAF